MSQKERQQKRRIRTAKQRVAQQDFLNRLQMRPINIAIRGAMRQMITEWNR